MKKIAHLAGALVLAAAGTLGLALPAAAAPSITAPATAGVGEVITVSGTECVGQDSVVTASVTSGDEAPIFQIEPSESGDWSFEWSVDADVVVAASCSTYDGTFDYATQTVKAYSDSFGPAVRTGCDVTIPVTSSTAGNYVVDVWDDRVVVASFPVTFDAAGAASVTWTITEPAAPAAIGVDFVLNLDDVTIDEIVNFEYPDDVMVDCASAGLSLVFPGYTGEVAPGGTLQIDAGGFLPGEEVTVTMFSTPVVLATLLADTQGRVVTTVTIPADATAGSHTIEVKGKTSGLAISLPILVKAGGAVATTTPRTTTPPKYTPAKYTPTLAATGTTASSMLPWAAGLVLLGGAALVLTRRRTSSHD